MNTKTLTAVALILAALPVAGFAQSAGSAARPNPPVLDFATADADGSGAISAEEWTAYAATLRDGMRAQRIEARVDAMIEAADADGDGALSRDEMIAGMTAMADERGAMRGERRMGGRFGMMRDHDGGYGMRGHHGRWDHERGDRDDRGGRWDHDRRGEGRMADRRGDGPMGDSSMGDRPMRGDRMAGDRMGGDRGMMGFARLDADRNGEISPDELAYAQEMLNWMAQRPGRN